MVFDTLNISVSNTLNISVSNTLDILVPDISFVKDWVTTFSFVGVQPTNVNEVAKVNNPGASKDLT